MSRHDQDIERFLHGFADAWSANDGDALADSFADDGSLINPFGQRADGRAAIAEMYSTYFAGMLKGTTTSITLEHVRTLGDGHALTDAEQTIYDSGGGIVLKVHLAAVLGQEPGGWRFLDSRPFTVAEAPA